MALKQYQYKALKYVTSRGDGKLYAPGEIVPMDHASEEDKMNRVLDGTLERFELPPDPVPVPKVDKPVKKED